ncbi:peritrophin-44 [Scaptodrosophila lebanonensis]|uniref:Peritrophin-44 n=1 Tax=Drosophila lebanonensis TaxID=7225 RepID=A0A6J2T511_DROLE|nr:peritrophin-44 [Scaptodrosophila lebanonensis]
MKEVQAFKFTASLVLVICGALLPHAYALEMEDLCKYWNGNGYVGNPSNCHDWGYCQGNSLVAWGSCDGTLVFNSPTSMCEYATNTTCYTNITESCSISSSAWYAPVTSNCSQYAYCNGQGTILYGECPKGQVFLNSPQPTCVWGPCPQDDICAFIPNNQYVGDPANCGGYLLCSNGIGIAGTCTASDSGQTRYFDYTLGGCTTTYPSVCGDSGNAGDDDTDDETTTPAPVTCTAEGYKDDGVTCYGYAYCAAASGNSKWGKCPFGLDFDPTSQECVSPASYACAATRNRCKNTNMVYATVTGTSCKQYTYCPNLGVGTCPSNYPYFDEVGGNCVQNKPSYAICGTS